MYSLMNFNNWNSCSTYFRFTKRFAFLRKVLIFHLQMKCNVMPIRILATACLWSKLHTVLSVAPKNKDTNQWTEMLHQIISRKKLNTLRLALWEWNRLCPCSPSTVIWHMQCSALLQALRHWSKERTLTGPANKKRNNDVYLLLITASPPTDFTQPSPYLIFSTIMSSPSTLDHPSCHLFDTNDFLQRNTIESFWNPVSVVERLTDITAWPALLVRSSTSSL